MDNCRKINYHTDMDIIEFEHLDLESNFIPVRVLYFPNEKLYPKCSLHWHEELEFYVITRGKVLLCCGEAQRWLSAGDIGFVHWCEPHCALEFGEGTERYIIQINPSFLNLTEPLKKQRYYYDVFTLNSAMLDHFFVQNADLFNLFMRLVAEMRKTSFFAELNIVGILFQIIAVVYESVLGKNSLKSTYNLNGKINQQHITRMLRYIRAHSTQRIILSDIALEVNLSVPYMCRLFKSHTGNSIVAYANKIKIECAVALMLNGYDLTRIYQHLGFDSYNYFARTFKKYKQISPILYLQKASEGVKSANDKR